MNPHSVESSLLLKLSLFSIKLCLAWTKLCDVGLKLPCCTDTNSVQQVGFRQSKHVCIIHSYQYTYTLVFFQKINASRLNCCDPTALTMPSGSVNVSYLPNSDAFCIPHGPEIPEERRIALLTVIALHPLWSLQRKIGKTMTAARHHVVIYKKNKLIHGTLYLHTNATVRDRRSPNFISPKMFKTN